MLQQAVPFGRVERLLPSVYSGLLASLCWIIGDLLLVGFTPQPESYPLLSQTYAHSLDVDLATHMLLGSTNRLMWGALIAVFSLPLYLYSAFSVGRLVQGKWRLAVFLLVFLGFAYAPVAHAGFFYVGEIYKAVIHTDSSAHSVLLETGSGFVRLLKICWITSLGFTAIGWLVFGTLVATGRTILKRSALWMNPIVFVLGISLVSALLPSPVQDWLACAVFNEAHFLFFAMLLIVLSRHRHI
ncbi:MAG: hypothetical protein Q4A64_04810 [Porphyromonadaceae bacterium]|nr:hypothetical protein [Porphyromonadaceae bacterium]